MQKNNMKIAFVMCINDSMYATEASRYINRLYVPEGYEIEIINVNNATSMTNGYNRAMKATDAEYKVYLHQDVFIVNKYFIIDMLEVFKDPAVGMLGVIGATAIPKDGIMWNVPRVGKMYSSNILNVDKYVMQEVAAPYAEVRLIDGMLMATQYDIPWREDVFTGWDFYDASQSLEMQKAGYKVVVPHMKEPWCLHDDGYINLADYFGWRDIFLKCYNI